MNNPDDRTAKLWNPATAECAQTLAGHGGGVNSAVIFVFSADGAAVLTASADGAAKLWDAATGECTQTFTGHRDGAAVLTASADGTAKLWNPAAGECTQTLTGHGAVVISAMFYSR